MPYSARKVPEVHWLAVRYEEHLAVNPLSIERHRRQDRVRLEKRDSGEQMSMGDVLDIGKVEEVLVVANLELCLSFTICRNHLGQQLDVALAEYASRADRAR
jgi:hypothetical protein